MDAIKGAVCSWCIWAQVFSKPQFSPLPALPLLAFAELRLEFLEPSCALYVRISSLVWKDEWISLLPVLLVPSGGVLLLFFGGGGGGYFIYYCVFKILEVLYNFRCRFFVYLEQINAFAAYIIMLL